MNFIDIKKNGKLFSPKQTIYDFNAQKTVVVPEAIPQISLEEIKILCENDFAYRLAFILGKFFSSLSFNSLYEISKNVCTGFEMNDPAPLIGLCEDEMVLELFHGKSYCYKDLGVKLFYEMLPLLGLQKYNEKTVISTDFEIGYSILKNNRSCMTFSSVNNCTEIQKIIAKGYRDSSTPFYLIDDDAENVEKSVLNCVDNLNEEPTSDYYVLTPSNYVFVISQIALFYSAYCDLVSSASIEIGDKINISLPAGNLSLATSCLYAKKMGLPLNKIIIGTNENNDVATLFAKGNVCFALKTKQTISPTLNYNRPAELERFLFEITARNGQYNRKINLATKDNELFTVEGIKFLSKDLYFYSCGDNNVLDCIAEYYEEFGYIFDTASAVGVMAGVNYFSKSGDRTPIIYVAITNPYFSPLSVHDSIFENNAKSLYLAIKNVYEDSGLEPPAEIFKAAQTKNSICKTYFITEIKQLIKSI